MTQSLVLKWRARIILVLAAAAGLTACGGNFKFTGTSPVDFGDVLVFTSSAPATLVWQNNGAAHEVIGGKAEASPPFTLAPITASVVATGKSVSLQYFFIPQAVGAVTGEAKLQTNRMGGRASSDKVALKGKGVFYITDGKISISETAGGGAPAQAIDFGKVPKGTSKTITVFVKNTPPAGAAAPAPVATTINWSLNNQGFTSTPVHGAGFAIPPNAPMPISITFTPADVGVYQDSVAFKDAAGKVVTGIMVKGEGVKPE